MLGKNGPLVKIRHFINAFIAPNVLQEIFEKSIIAFFRKIILAFLVLLKINNRLQLKAVIAEQFNLLTISKRNKENLLLENCYERMFVKTTF